MPSNTFEGDLRVTGTLSPLRFNAPAGSITDAAIAVNPNSPIDNGKVKHQFPISYSQTGTISDDTAYLLIARGSSGALITLEAAVTEAVATDLSRTVTIDLQKSSGGGSFSTVLTGTFQFTSSSVLRTVYAATISTPAYLDGDLFRLVITVAGSAGSQAQGLLITLFVAENPSP